MNTCLSKNEVYFMEGIEISYIKILQKELIENKSSIFFPYSEKNISFLFFLSGQGMLKINAFGGMNKYKISSNYYITVPPCNDILEYIAKKNTDILKFNVQQPVRQPVACPRGRGDVRVGLHARTGHE